PLTLNCIGTLPGPCTGTCSPAAMTRFGLATTGTAAAIVEIFRKSRRETPDVSSRASFGSLGTDSSSCIPVLHAAGRVRPAVAGLRRPQLWEAGETRLHATTRLNGEICRGKVYSAGRILWVGGDNQGGQSQFLVGIEKPA